MDYELVVHLIPSGELANTLGIVFCFANMGPVICPRKQLK